MWFKPVVQELSSVIDDEGLLVVLWIFRHCHRFGLDIDSKRFYLEGPCQLFTSGYHSS